MSSTFQQRGYIAQRFAVSAMLGSVLVHLLCCGLPLLTYSITGATMLGLNSAELFSVSWVERYEQTLFAFSSLMFLATLLLYIISKRVDCRTEGACAHAPCDSKKRVSFNFFYLTAALYLLNCGMYLLDAHAH